MKIAEIRNWERQLKAAISRAFNLHTSRVKIKHESGNRFGGVAGGNPIALEVNGNTVSRGTMLVRQ